MQALAKAFERQGFGGPRVRGVAHEVPQARDGTPLEDEPGHERHQPRAYRFPGPADLVAMPLRRFARGEAPPASAIHAGPREIDGRQSVEPRAMPMAAQAVASMPKGFVGRDIDPIEKVAPAQEVERIGDATNALPVHRGGTGSVTAASLVQPFRGRIGMAAAHLAKTGRPRGQRHGADRLSGHGHDLRTL